MISIVWRIRSNGFKAKKFVHKFDLEPDEIFEDGFNFCILDTETKDEVIQSILSFIEKHRNAYKELVAQDIKSQIDIGVDVGADDQFTCSIKLPSENMDIFSSHNIDFIVSAYPASD